MGSHVQESKGLGFTVSAQRADSRLFKSFGVPERVLRADGGEHMVQSLRRPGSAIRVLVVTPDNMTGELLTGAFSQRRSDFSPTTLGDSSSSVIGKLGSHEPDFVQSPLSCKTVHWRVLMFYRSYEMPVAESLPFCSFNLPRPSVREHSRAFHR